MSDSDPIPGERPVRARRRLVVRLAGALLTLVGIANVALGGLALTTSAFDLPDTTATTLVVLGIATALLAGFVAAGRRWAMLLALVVFGGLFAVQAFGATGGAPAPAVVTLAVVLVPLVLAIRATMTDE